MSLLVDVLIYIACLQSKIK